MSSRNRTQGHNLERTIVKELKEMGFNEAVTARSESRNMDDRGVDIMGNIPFYIQCKYSMNNPNYHSLLTSPKLPTDKPLVVLHRKCHKANIKFVTDGDYVIITKDYFYDLISNYLI